MRKWLAGKLFDLAVRLDWEVTVIRAALVMRVEHGLQETFMIELGMAERKPRRRKTAAKPKVQAAPKKLGRPLGSKNKPKVVA